MGQFRKPGMTGVGSRGVWWSSGIGLATAADPIARLSSEAPPQHLSSSRPAASRIQVPRVCRHPSSSHLSCPCLEARSNSDSGFRVGTWFPRQSEPGVVPGPQLLGPGLQTNSPACCLSISLCKLIWEKLFHGQRSLETS